MGKRGQGKVEKGLTSSSNQVKQRSLTMIKTKPRKRFKAIVWTKKEKFKVEYKEKSFKDLDTRVHYPISSAYRGFSMLGGRSNKCRYA
mgnify:CR=1 FL=1